MVTPHDLHHGLAQGRRDARANVLLDAWAKNPERFPRGCPVPPVLPTAAWINKPPTTVSAQLAAQPDGQAPTQRGGSPPAAALAVPPHRAHPPTLRSPSTHPGPSPP